MVKKVLQQLSGCCSKSRRQDQHKHSICSACPLAVSFSHLPMHLHHCSSNCCCSEPAHCTAAVGAESVHQRPGEWYRRQASWTLHCSFHSIQQSEEKGSEASPAEAREPALRTLGDDAGPCLFSSSTAVSCIEGAGCGLFCIGRLHCLHVCSWQYLHL